MTGDGSARDRAVEAQYEAYPYPARDPRDEARRLVLGSPSDLRELNHYVFGGRLDLVRPFRALFAGGGTGDGCIMLAQQLADAGTPAEVVHLDTSRAARDIAEARARARNLNNVRFVTASLFDLPTLGLGTFDYIDCCGVLHHLEDPLSGLKALANVLAREGGMGLMLYAPSGRTGVYEMQEMLRALASIDRPPGERIGVARRLLKALPPTNLLRRNPFVRDHLDGTDAGLYDLLLHPRDRAFTVDETATLCRDAGLRIEAFIEPARYQPAIYIADRQLLGEVDRLAWLERCAFAERLAGNIRKHVFYAVPASRPTPAAAVPDGTAIPMLREMDAEAFARTARSGKLGADLGGFRLELPLPRLAPALASRIDGERTLDTILSEVATGAKMDRARVERDWASLYGVLNGLNKLVLRFPTG